MCLALGADGLDRRTLLGRLARLGGSAAALMALGPVVWAQSGNDRSAAGRGGEREATVERARAEGRPRGIRRWHCR